MASIRLPLLVAVKNTLVIDRAWDDGMNKFYLVSLKQSSGVYHVDHVDKNPQW